MLLVMKRTELKRKTPLQARTPLKRSSSGLRQKTPLKPRSEKMARIYREERIPLVKELLATFPYCKARLVNCTGRSTDVHEIKSRGRGGSITDRANCVTLCRSCHSWITDHPKEGLEMGFLKHSWDD